MCFYVFKIYLNFNSNISNLFKFYNFLYYKLHISKELYQEILFCSVKNKIFQNFYYYIRHIYIYIYIYLSFILFIIIFFQTNMRVLKLISYNNHIINVQ